jgi:myo-inositol-1(or 4)-monophosphatase
LSLRKNYLCNCPDIIINYSICKNKKAIFNPKWSDRIYKMKKTTVEEFDRNEMMNLAINTAHETGEILLKNLGSLQKKSIVMKGVRDMVTDIDLEAQDFISARILSHFPHHVIIGEEHAEHDKSGDFRWFIDPLDGTVNYVHSYPMFAVSIALEVKGVMELGVICIPRLREMFHVVRGSGAFLNRKQIRVSATPTLIESILATGFPYKRNEMPRNNVELFNRFIFNIRGIRRSGAAAIDLAYVACGRLDGFWELQLKPWDTAAGALMVVEAGGKVTNFRGHAHFWDNGEVIASNGLIHQMMQEVISDY